MIPNQPNLRTAATITFYSIRHQINHLNRCWWFEVTYLLQVDWTQMLQLPSSVKLPFFEWRKVPDPAHLELAQPISILEDAQIKLPSPRPMALTMVVTAIFPADETRGRVSGLCVSVKLMCFCLPGESGDKWAASHRNIHNIEGFVEATDSWFCPVTNFWIRKNQFYI